MRYPALYLQGASAFKNVLSAYKKQAMPAWLNGHYIPYDEAKLHVSDLSMQRAYALFDFFRTVKGVPLFMEDHLDRFYGSASAMHLEVPVDRESIRDIVKQLLQQSGLAEAGIRLMLTGGYSADGYQPGAPNFLISCRPVKVATEEDFEKGYSIITYEHRRELPQIKSINYLTAVWLQPLLKEKWANDVLYYQEGIISEFPRSNVFIVTREGTLLTPAHYMLHGITRKNVLALAEKIMPVEVRDISVEELDDAAEVFLTATTKKIIPVLAINAQPVGNGRPGQVTRELFSRFLELEQTL